MKLIYFKILQIKSLIEAPSRSFTLKPERRASAVQFFYSTNCRSHTAGLFVKGNWMCSHEYSAMKVAKLRAEVNLSTCRQPVPFAARQIAAENTGQSRPRSEPRAASNRKKHPLHFLDLPVPAVSMGQKKRKHVEKTSQLPPLKTSFGLFSDLRLCVLLGTRVLGASWCSGCLKVRQSGSQSD